MSSVGLTFDSYEDVSRWISPGALPSVQAVNLNAVYDATPARVLLQLTT